MPEFVDHLLNELFAKNNKRHQEVLQLNRRMQILLEKNQAMNFLSPKEKESVEKLCTHLFQIAEQIAATKVDPTPSPRDIEIKQDYYLGQAAEVSESMFRAFKDCRGVMLLTDDINLLLTELASRPELVADTELYKVLVMPDDRNPTTSLLDASGMKVITSLQLPVTEFVKKIPPDNPNHDAFKRVESRISDSTSLSNDAVKEQNQVRGCMDRLHKLNLQLKIVEQWKKPLKNYGGSFKAGNDLTAAEVVTYYNNFMQELNAISVSYSAIGSESVDSLSVDNPMIIEIESKLDAAQHRVSSMNYENLVFLSHCDSLLANTKPLSNKANRQMEALVSTLKDPAADRVKLIDDAIIQRQKERSRFAEARRNVTGKKDPVVEMLETLKGVATTLATTTAEEKSANASASLQVATGGDLLRIVDKLKNELGSNDMSQETQIMADQVNTNAGTFKLTTDPENTYRILHDPNNPDVIRIHQIGTTKEGQKKFQQYATSLSDFVTRHADEINPYKTIPMDIESIDDADSDSSIPLTIAEQFLEDLRNAPSDYPGNYAINTVDEAGGIYNVTFGNGYQGELQRVINPATADQPASYHMLLKIGDKPAIEVENFMDLNSTLNRQAEYMDSQQTKVDKLEGLLDAAEQQLRSEQQEHQTYNPALALTSLEKFQHDMAQLAGFTVTPHPENNTADVKFGKVQVVVDVRKCNSPQGYSMFVEVGNERLLMDKPEELQRKLEGLHQSATVKHGKENLERVRAITTSDGRVLTSAYVKLPKVEGEDEEEEHNPSHGGKI